MWDAVKILSLSNPGLKYSNLTNENESSLFSFV